MADEFKRVRIHAALQEAPFTPPRRGVLRGAGPVGAVQPGAPSFHTPEAAARFYLSEALRADGRPALRGVTAPDRPGLVPELSLVETQDLPLTETQLVRFKQTHQTIPVFGSKAVVEVDRDGELLSLDTELADIDGVSATASLSPVQALQAVADFTGVEAGSLSAVVPPQLRFFLHRPDGPDTAEWRLAYLLVDVPAAPPGFFDPDPDRPRTGHGLGPSPRRLYPRLNYLVDAHRGEILFLFSATPTVDVEPEPIALPIDVPTKCLGYDVDGVRHEFFGRAVDDGYDLRDSMRDVATYDLRFGPVAVGYNPAPVPARPVTGPASDYERSHPGAVSAHVNATRVFDFYNSVLLRDGVDGRGMELISLVNCTMPDDEPPPEWHNAVWWDHRMWYGQARDSAGQLASWSRYLDVIAHELTHGVTEFTANLVYEGESGALNESVSDIFGVIIANWYRATDPEDVTTWSWELGTGLGSDGLPLRDLSDPRRTGDPDHMDDFVHWPVHQDSGGVHVNSGIHNKAAYNVLTARTASGQRAFSVREASYLYYLALTRLTEQAPFGQILNALIDVAATYFRGNPNEMNEKIAQLRAAYAAVGIEPEG